VAAVEAKARTSNPARLIVGHWPLSTAKAGQLRYLMGALRRLNSCLQAPCPRPSKLVMRVRFFVTRYAARITRRSSASWQRVP
jgi:hypothetical protein